MNIIVLDLETTISSDKHGASAKDSINDFHTLIYGDSPENVIVEHEEKGFTRKPSHRFWELLLKSDVLLGHNLPFDLSYIWNNEEIKQWILSGGKIWDTQLAEYLMSGQRHAFPSLGELQRIYLKTKIKEDRISKLYKKKIGADKIIKARKRCPRLFNLFDKYSRDDGETTIRIYHEQVKRAEALGMTKIIRLFNDYLLSLIQCMNTGIVVDKIKCENTLRDFNIQSIELLQKAQELIKPFWNDKRLPEFNVNSPQHKSALLFGGDIKCTVREHVGQYKNGKDKFKNVEHVVKVDGFQLPKSLTTESKIKGRYQTGSDIINKIVKQGTHETAIEYCKLQVEAMNIHKMANTYLKAFISLSIANKEREFRLLPNFNITKTTTSRLSSSNPNLQNVPSKGPMAKAIQGCFVAPQGWKCVQIDFCLTPETRVLNDDFKWVEIGTVKEGDTLIGFDEYVNAKKMRHWKPGHVEKVKRLVKDCVRITTEEGVITCSKDHMFLASGKPGHGNTLFWTKAEDLTTKSCFSKAMEVWETPNNYETGWGAGFLDGEGYLSNSSQIGFGQNDDGHNKLCYDKMSNLFEKYLINSENRVCDKKRCKKVRPAGLRTGWQAVGIFQPDRLKAKLKEQYINTTIRSRNNRRVKILKIEEVGKQEVVAVQTSSKTFLAEGFLSHNCQLEIYVLAWLSGDKQMTKDLLGGIDFHCLRLSWASTLAQGKSYEEIVDLAKVQEVPEWVLKRSKAKTISYQKAYGAGPKSLSESTGLDIEDVKELLNKEDQIYYRVKAFNDYVYQQVENTAEYSHANNLPELLKKGGVNGKRFTKDGYELLPIKTSSKTFYDNNSYRNVGFFQSITGKRYAYEEYATVTKEGRTRRGFSPTQTKNYQIQGTASDIQAVTSAALLPLLLKHSDKVQFINEIHDSKWFYVKEEFIDLIVPKLCTIMEATPKLFKKYLNIDMPFHVPVDAEIGDNFANLRTYIR